MYNTEKINEIAKENDFSGVISISENGSEIYCQAFGYQNIANAIPNKINTKFGIASGTKLFTALGIGKLIEDKIISFDTKIHDIDKSYHTFIDENATILNLLTHTSGIFDYYNEELISDADEFFVSLPWYALKTPSDYMPLFYNQKYKFPSGKKYSYSNGGYVFLAILIEKLSGVLYRDFLYKNILLPANMNNSGFFVLNELPPNTALGYKSNRLTTNIYDLPIRGGGDGGLFTTCQDLAEFWKHFFSGKIVSIELVNEYLKTKWKFNDIYGYGCGIYKSLNDTFYSIIGGDPGVGFYSRYLPDNDIVLSILSNITDGNKTIQKDIIKHLEEITKAI